MSKGRALTGAVLLDLAVSPLFAWDVFTASLRRDLGAGDAPLAGVFSIGLLTFMVGVWSWSTTSTCSRSDRTLPRVSTSSSTLPTSTARWRSAATCTPPDGFDESMPKTLATATVDWLLHHSHICLTDGESFRLAQVTPPPGTVRPLPT